MDGGGGGKGVCLQSQADRLGDGLRSRERLHVHRVDVEDVTRWGQTHQLIREREEKERGRTRQACSRGKTAMAAGHAQPASM